MRCVGCTLGIIAVQTVPRDIVQILNAILLQLLECSSKRSVVVCVKLLLIWQYPIVSEASVFHQNDWNIGFSGSKLLDERNAFSGYIRRSHVRQAIDHEGGSIDLD